MKMKKKLASMLTVIMLACSLPWQAQAAVATPPAVSEAQPVKAVPEPAAVKADTAAKPAAEVKAPKQAKPEKKAKKTAKKKSKKTKEKQQPKVQVQQSNWRLKVAQQKLQVLGFSDERPSGRMTEATSSALKSFQKQHKLKADGELNDATYQKLTWEAFTKEGIPKVKGREIVSRAAKYKGVPYVFGGTTTKGFDCSGYVCWVYNQNGYDVGRTTANGLWNKSQHISEAEAKPGDLVFFKGTYDTPGMSHTGIYLGNGMMVSAGDPIKYANIHSSYWEKHLAGFGRLSK